MINQKDKMFSKAFLTTVFVLSGLLLQTGTVTATCIASPITVRLPPTFDNGASTATWNVPPIDWDWGYWYQTISSSANEYQRNLQYHTIPLEPINDPAGVRTDFSHFQLTINDTTVYTSYGLLTPVPEGWPFSWNYTGTGILSPATDFLDILAWGTDCNGVGYVVSHSTLVEYVNYQPTLDIRSRTVTGPDPCTVRKLKKAFIALGDEEITTQARNWVRAIHDSGRDGMPLLDYCDEECQTNENLLPLLGILG